MLRTGKSQTHTPDVSSSAKLCTTAFGTRSQVFAPLLYLFIQHLLNKNNSTPPSPPTFRDSVTKKSDNRGIGLWQDDDNNSGPLFANSVSQPESPFRVNWTAESHVYAKRDASAEQLSVISCQLRARLLHVHIQFLKGDIKILNSDVQNEPNLHTEAQWCVISTIKHRSPCSFTPPPPPPSANPASPFPSPSPRTCLRLQINQ